jgi:hypothetical protein
MAREKLKDREAKAILLKWPTSTTKLWDVPQGNGAWVQALPKAAGGAACPALQVPGAQIFKTQPDGMWVYFDGQRSCDVVVIEVCGSVQNLNDKRARYMPSTHSTVLRVPSLWTKEMVVGQGGHTLPRSELAGTLDDVSAKFVHVPVRVLRVLYALPTRDYHRWAGSHVPTGYEYFVPHSSLNSYTAPKMQAFLRRMSISSQFYLAPRRPR